MRRTVFAVDETETRLLGGDSQAVEWGRLGAVIVAGVFCAAPAIGFLNSLRILTALGFMAMFFGYGRPALGLIGLTLVCTIDPLTRHFLTGAGPLRWNTFNYCLLAIMLISAPFLWRIADLQTKFLKAFVALMVVQLVISPAMEEGIQHLLGIVTIFGMLVILAQAADDPDIWYAVGLVNGVAGAVGGLIFLVFKESLPYINSNAWALFPEAGIFAVCLGFRAASLQPAGQLILGGLATTNAMWAFLSGSRGGILIASIGIIYILTSMKKVTHQLLYLAAALAIVLFSLRAFSAMEGYTMHRINKMLDDEQTAAGRTSGRSDLALAAWHMVQAHPLGVGTGAFAESWAQIGFVPGLSGFKRGEEFQAHSAWAKVIAENGWIGMLTLVGYVLSFTWSGVQARQVKLGLYVTVTLIASFMWTEFQAKAVWLLAAGAAVQLHPEEMRRAVTAEVERFTSRPRRILSQMRVRSAEASGSSGPESDLLPLAHPK